MSKLFLVTKTGRGVDKMERNPHCERSLVHLYVVGEDFGKQFWE